MPVLLEGGCRVGEVREGVPEVRGGLGTFRHVDRRTGATAISLRVLELAPESDCALENPAGDEVLYVLEGRGRLRGGRGRGREVVADTGIYLAPGTRLEIENPGPGPLVLVSSRCPEPGDDREEHLSARAPEPSGDPPIVSLAERRSETTADRWYRVLLDESVGSKEVTQFVGGIPPGRAPDHFHEYEEVLCILSGRGRLWAGRSHAPIEAGTWAFLPRRQVHCVENTGEGELRLLGVFYPAGSPAVRYEAD